MEREWKIPKGKKKKGKKIKFQYDFSANTIIIKKYDDNYYLPSLSTNTDRRERCKKGFKNHNNHKAGMNCDNLPPKKSMSLVRF